MRQMTKVRALGLAIAGLTALASTVSAADNGYQGTLCNPNTPTDASKIGYNQYGVHNTAATAAVVACGALPVVGSDVNLITATVHDRNAVANVCCTMLVQEPNGGVIASAVRCSANSSPAAQLLSWVPPVNVAGTVNLECSIPSPTGAGHSHVTSYRVRSNP